RDPGPRSGSPLRAALRRTPAHWPRGGPPWTRAWRTPPPRAPHRIRLAERSSESLGSSAPAAETQALAERAVAGGTLLSGELGAFLAATLILAYTGRTDLAATLAQDAIAATRERGELAMLRFALGVQGEVHWHAG